MALRILTGFLKPRPGKLTHGQAKISFDPHMVGGDAAGVELEETGAAGRFISRPGKVVALRDFVGEDRTRGRGKRIGLGSMITCGMPIV
jgi:hypothetical protein